jgi:hypothetical protein
MEKDSRILSAKTYEDACEIIKTEAAEDSYFHDISFNYQENKIVISQFDQGSFHELGCMTFFAFPHMPIAHIEIATAFGAMTVMFYFSERIHVKQYVAYLKDITSIN